MNKLMTSESLVGQISKSRAVSWNDYATAFRPA
jgi:hypothetical protein